MSSEEAHLSCIGDECAPCHSTFLFYFVVWNDVVLYFFVIIILKLVVVYLFVQGVKFLKLEMLTTPASAGFTETQSGGFSDALSLYERRPDKGYSLTDCRSMLLMRQRGLTDILTHDHHFTQEGFTILFP